MTSLETITKKNSFCELVYITIFLHIAYFGPLSRGQPHSPVNHCISTNSIEMLLGGHNEVGSLSSAEHLVKLELWFFYRLTWLTSAIHQMVNWIGSALSWAILQNFISFFLWSWNKQRKVVLELKEHVFTVFGLPHILHSDNGREFVNNLIVDTIRAWPGECKLVNRKTKSPRVQGCVEKGNHCVEMMITTKCHEKSSNNWGSWLPEIQCKWSIRVQLS